MSLQPDAFKREIEKAITSLVEEKGTDLALKIKSVLYANLARKRPQKFTENNPGSVKNYVNRVVEKYEHFNSYIHQLQVEKSDDVWAPLVKDMRKWSYRFLVKKGYNENETTWENAKECANEAARSILKAHFPFDTDFEPWARVVAQNTCLKFIRDNAKEVPILEESLDNLEGRLQDFSGTVSSDELHLWNEHKDLSECISQLTDSRRQVIEMKYFQDLSPNEIAAKMGKNVRAVYSLQFRALQDLRKILTQNRNKFNE